MVIGAKLMPVNVICNMQDGKKLTNTEHTRIEYYKTRCMVIIDHVTADDEGEYMCEAQNVHGVCTTAAHLLVESKHKARARSRNGVYLIRRNVAC